MKQQREKIHDLEFEKTQLIVAANQAKDELQKEQDKKESSSIT